MQLLRNCLPDIGDVKYLQKKSLNEEKNCSSDIGDVKYLQKKSMDEEKNCLPDIGDVIYVQKKNQEEEYDLGEVEYERMKQLSINMQLLRNCLSAFADTKKIIWKC